VDSWHRNLQDLCYEEVNSRIADSRARVLAALQKRLDEAEMIELLEDHIAAERMAETQAAHRKQLEDVRTLASATDRKRRLAVLMLDILPARRSEELLQR